MNLTRSGHSTFVLALRTGALLITAISLLGGCGAADGTQIDDTQVATQDLTLTGVTLQTVLVPRYLGAANNGGGAVNATATVAQGWETFSLEDVNGGSLVSGDSVLIRAGNGQYFQALNGGGSSLNAGSNNALGWETFKIVKKTGTGTIVSGDIIGLQASSGSWISAQSGGGGAVFAYGGALGSWEQLKIGLGGSSTPTPPTSGTPAPRRSRRCSRPPARPPSRSGSRCS